jgi:hypothetical protein
VEFWDGAIHGVFSVVSDLVSIFNLISCGLVSEIKDRNNVGWQIQARLGRAWLRKAWLRRRKVGQNRNPDWGQVNLTNLEP